MCPYIIGFCSIVVFFGRLTFLAESCCKCWGVGWGCQCGIGWWGCRFGVICYRRWTCTISCASTRTHPHALPYMHYCPLPCMQYCPLPYMHYCPLPYSRTTCQCCALAWVEPWCHSHTVLHPPTDSTRLVLGTIAHILLDLSTNIWYAQFC